MSYKLTESDIDKLKVGWRDYEDFFRYVDRQEIEPVLKDKHPEVLKAFNKYLKSIKRVTRALNGLDYGD